MSNPSTIAVALDRKGKLTLYNGAVDIGQGSNTVMAQIAADALGLPVNVMRVVMGDTALTADAGKTSASRQTFISGKAAELAGRDLRRQILRLSNAGEAIGRASCRERVCQYWAISGVAVSLQKKVEPRQFMQMQSTRADRPT